MVNVRNRGQGEPLIDLYPGADPIIDIRPDTLMQGSGGHTLSVLLSANDPINDLVRLMFAAQRLRVSVQNSYVDRNNLAAAEEPILDYNAATNVLTVTPALALAALTQSGDLLFSPDATYDIGKSGATRPRDFFASRNGSFGGTLTALGQATIGNLIASSVNANGQSTNIVTETALLTVAAAATSDTTLTIPAGCLLLGVTVRVTVVIPTAATFDYGIAGATTRFGTGVAVAAGTTYPGTDAGVQFYAAATAIRVTPNATPGAATGRIRITIHYISLNPASS